MNPAAHCIDIVRVGSSAGVLASDVAAAEEPLEIRLGGQPFVVSCARQARTATSQLDSFCRNRSFASPAR